VSQQDVPKDGAVELQFLVKFYPEDVVEELIQDVTRHFFFLQTYRAIISDEYYCPPETSVLLASYYVQSKFGDYDKSIHRSGFLGKV
jgi:hypothetical protein